jgi:hypothetical protein
MNEFENIQRLMRLKRHERPAEDFVEDFLASFKERQRAELLRQSARGLLLERLGTLLGDFISPRWTTAGATAAVAVLAAWTTFGIIGGGRQDLPAYADASELSSGLPPQPVLEVDSELIKGSPKTRPLGQARPLEIQAIQLSFNGDVLPAEYQPVDRISELAGLGTVAMPFQAGLLSTGFEP